MGKTITHLLVLLAIVVSVSCDDDNGPPTGPSVTETTQTGAFAPQPAPNPLSPAPPAGPPFPAPNPPPAPIYPMFGDVHAVTGLCPVIRLTVGGRDVVTDRSTVFVIACRSIRTKSLVRISGRINTAGTMIATTVEPSSR